MTRPKSDWQDITDLLTEAGSQALKDGKDIGIKVGQVLRFKQELSGNGTDMKIMRLDRRSGKLWAKETQLRDPKDLDDSYNVV